MTVSSIDANPSTFQVLSNETIPFTLEWADLIGQGNAVSTPNAVMYDNSNGIQTPNAFVNNYGANGTQAQYIIDGTKLQPEHTYTAICTVNVGTQVFKQRIIVTVPR
jgi:hypothetical protein